MTEAPALRFKRRPIQTLRPQADANSFTALSFDRVAAVEIVAPDGYCAALLAGYAGPMFPAEIVPGSNWIVRFAPPQSGGDWVVDLLKVVERWLEAAPLPCAKLLYNGTSHLVRAPAGRVTAHGLPSAQPEPEQAA
jgi:hypothetical protein